MKFYCGFLFLLASYTAGSQSIAHSKYIVITIERERTKDNHAMERAYWIVSMDSLQNFKYSLAPLYIDGFSLNNFKECCGKKSITIFYQTDSTSYKFDEQYLAAKKSLSDLVKAKRKKVQTIAKGWTKGVREKINVYITPVSGDFCYCRVDKDGSKKLEYQGMIVIPKSGFSSEDKFWSSEKSSQVSFFDFSSLPFLNLQSIL
ncbi:MAG: hypothetical protein WDN75_05150 [Bacteroidota bacterium]